MKPAFDKNYYLIMTYSIDFRKKVLSITGQENLTFAEVSKRFGVGQASVVRWSSRIEPQQKRDKPSVKLDGEKLAQDVETYLESYQYERAERFGVSQSGIAYALKTLKLSRKKNFPTSQSGSGSPTTISSPNSQLP
jgi:transposase